MLRKLDSGELYFWHENGARTMVTISGRGMPAPRISSVFTPQECRGRGYASQAVSAVCEALRADGAPYVVLTATHGLAAARIYKRLGFYPVGERHSYTVVSQATSDHPVD
jgi:predicted GNAT family acetyltransferase